ncbi:hypothetical protein HYALB_00002687 [Hymenoscyphus albidus]|uniref:FAD-binding PCMH-type domain-containing protein n=1 Tax=Hymenoscyphus albidus TaxID=595503 RepID=A0A9N9QD82_9HELO|nr:hypothetical protein HYALB_00002687 [Hymenoscyphus albidus]
MHLVKAHLVLAFCHLGLTFPNNKATDPFEELLSNPSSTGLNLLDISSADLEAQLQTLKASSSLHGFSKCQVACALLPLFAMTVSNSNSSGYEPLPYWSIQQAEVKPGCRVDVSSAKDISNTVLISRLTQCPFAVKSGGHAAFAGASSIQDGMLINLAKLNMVSLSSDRTVTQVGPGNTWHDVYRQLDPLGVSVVGGREAGVGVGGLLLGGGISYFSGRFGWGCDNVVNYEVVLASGAIVNASPTSHADLYWALRGGSGTNFGIVSRFDLATFEQGLLWGGSKYYNADQNNKLVDAYTKFLTDAPTDNFAHLYVSYGYAAQLGGFIGVAGPTYGKAIGNATIFETLNKIPVLGDETGFASMGDLALALNQTTLARFKTVTFKNDPALFKGIVKIFTEEASTVLTVPGLAPFFAFQPISDNIVEHMQKNGGNALGLSTADGPLTIMNLNWGWTNEVYDALVLETVDRFVSRSVALAESKGLNHSFIYMNYAKLEQDVFGGYGAKNVARLKRIQHKFDPKGVFKSLQPGYFKLK